jgi:hypothetical protein
MWGINHDLNRRVREVIPGDGTISIVMARKLGDRNINRLFDI